MTPLIAGLVCAFAAIAVAQTTHVVGPGAYGQAVTPGALALQLSPVAGGVVR